MHKAKQFFFAGIISDKRGELLMNQRKSLKELNLLDKFLFDEAMDDPENVKTMLDIILSQNTNRKHPELVSTELIELLKYMERSTDEVSGECKSKRIQEMHRRVCQIKACEKTEVAAALSKAEINVATMQVFRDKRGGTAVMVVETDQVIPQSAIDELESKPGIIRVKFLDPNGSV